MSENTDQMKKSFLAYVQQFTLTPEQVSWHLNQTTALEGIVDQEYFQESFDTQKTKIAGILFETLTEYSGASLTIDRAKDAWDRHATENPFLAANLAMVPKQGPQTSFARRQGVLPSRKR